MKLRLMAGIALVTLSLVAIAGAPNPTRYTLEWEAPAGGATATGFIVLDRSIVTTPIDTFWELPDPAVLDFEITVSGTAGGDGTWTIADYNGIVFETNGGALDLDTELVGQPTNNDPWGTPSSGDGGDFNIFAGGPNRGPFTGYDDLEQPQGMGTLPPTGVFFFELGVNGGSGESLFLTSFRPAGPAQAISVPTLSAIGLALMLGALLAIGMFATVRRGG